MTREFGLIEGIIPLGFPKAQSLDEMLVEKADHHYKMLPNQGLEGTQERTLLLRYKMNFVKSRSYD